MDDGTNPVPKGQIVRQDFCQKEKAGLEKTALIVHNNTSFLEHTETHYRSVTHATSFLRVAKARQVK